MKQRLLFLLKLALLFLAFFALEKPFFMLYNLNGAEYSFADWIKVVLNGLKLDSSVMGYFLVFPWLVVLFTFWVSKLPIKKILTPYYLFLSILMSVCYVADTSLYEFWGTKLDASVFNYLDSPQNAFASVSFGYIIVRFLVILLLAAFAYYLMRRITPSKFRKIDALLADVSIRKTMFTILWLLLAIPIFITIRGGVKESTSNVGRSYFCSTQFLNHSAVNPIFSFLVFWLYKDLPKEIAFSIMSYALRKAGYTFCPNSVSSSPPYRRSNSGNPISSSICATCLLTAGRVIKSFSPAREKLFNSAAVRKQWICVMVMSFPLCVNDWFLFLS